ncbi:Suppressor of G2 allele of SKP1 like protein [Eufriesea mexicana]|uniref:Suppressor of G2 allele of SKP1 like protein n=1 Tax=Eufriesea mexicana TaxID=516756 RepID=A0A310SFT2_9HYME|nr:PREDICTED: protein SGT1 homolog [Eufriesea mexicana]OAD53886.1 Suppressor of G2 allele of SKP1 like protein [Eufriesea mexicana]
MGNEETPTAVNNNEMPIPKIKHDWYQTESHVVVPVLAKGAKNVKVIYEQRSLSVTALLPSGNEYSLELDLAHPIVTDQCSHKVDPSKIEIKLKKQDGIMWTTLEGNPIAQKTVQPIPQEILQAGNQPEKNLVTGRKQRDWNKVEKEIEKQEAEEKLVGEAALCALFQQIYGSGSDEVKRAMNKSIQESGGTVLSTNWAEVSKGKVEVKLPDGMEWKPWNT